MIPQPRNIKQPLLLLVHLAGGSTSKLRAGETYDILADVLGVSTSERKEQRDQNQGSVWHSKVQNARKTLVEQGLLEALNGENRGEWQLTAAGHQMVEKLLASGARAQVEVQGRMLPMREVVSGLQSRLALPRGAAEQGPAPDGARSLAPLGTAPRG